MMKNSKIQKKFKPKFSRLEISIFQLKFAFESLLHCSDLNTTILYIWGVWDDFQRAFIRLLGGGGLGGYL